MKHLLLISFLYVLSFFTAAPVFAQNVGGVFPPMVNEDHKSLQYRVAVNPDNTQDEFGYAHRLHYQQSISGDLMWRIVGQAKKTSNSDHDFDFLGAELFWELSNDDNQHKSGFRFDARIRDDNRSEVFGFHWMNQFNFDNGWHVRALAMSFVQAGGNAADGINLQTRAQISKKLETGHTIGAELYNNYGNTGNIGSFNDQSHTIGPFISVPVGEGVTLWVGPLFGISDAAPDVEARLWITKGF